MYYIVFFSKGALSFMSTLNHLLQKLSAFHINAGILLLIYFYSCLQTQVSVHHELLERQEIFCHVYRVSRHAQATEKQMQGLCRIMMRSECQGRIYLIQPADLILTGEEAKLYLQK